MLKRVYSRYYIKNINISNKFMTFAFEDIFELYHYFTYQLLKISHNIIYGKPNTMFSKKYLLERRNKTQVNHEILMYAIF